MIRLFFIEMLFKELFCFSNLRNKMYQFLLFFQPLVFLTIIKFMLEIRPNVQLEKYVIASGIVSMWGYILYSCGSSLVAEKWSGTLNLLLAAPTTLFKIIASKAISNSLIGLLSLVLTLVYSKLIFGFELHINYLTFFESVILLLISLTSIGIILSIIFAVSKNVFEFQNLILYPILLLSGVFYSTELFPNVLQYLSWLLPMTWSIKNIYLSLDKTSIDLESAILTIVLVLLYILIGYLLIKRIEKTMQNSSKMGLI